MKADAPGPQFDDGRGFRTYVSLASLFTAPALLGTAYLTGHGDGVVIVLGVWVGAGIGAYVGVRGMDTARSDREEVIAKWLVGANLAVGIAQLLILAVLLLIVLTGDYS